ncbi:MAG: hypothetical protein AAGF12_07525 [Myxococcota bacterium]
MAAKAKKSDGPIVEEVLFRSDSAFLCLLVNHRTKFIRVIDFRAGALPAKRLFIQSVAKREGIEKVITLVEKDEVSSWTRVGFVREGTIPGFYKRSDGHLCGCVIGDKTASIEVSDAGVKLADRTINQAKKIIKDFPEKIKGLSVHEVEASEAETARNQAVKKGIALNTFDTFGRDAERFHYDCSLRRSKTNYLSAEFQDCFGHSLVEVLRRPDTDNERLAIVGALGVMCDDLKERGIISAFGFAPSDDVDMAAAYLGAGFRKTGLLAGGIPVGDERKDAILWSRKLANPGQDDD